MVGSVKEGSVFCKYSHEYLYSYNKFTSSKCDETLDTSDHLKAHQKNLSEANQEVVVNLKQEYLKTNEKTKNLERKENEEETCSSSSSSLVTTSTLSSITSSSQNSSFSANSSEREEIGGMSRSNSL